MSPTGGLGKLLTNVANGSAAEGDLRVRPLRTRDYPHQNAELRDGVNRSSRHPASCDVQRHKVKSTEQALSCARGPLRAVPGRYFALVQGSRDCRKRVTAGLNGHLDRRTDRLCCRHGVSLVLTSQHSWTPRTFAACSASRVRCEICSRSYSAKADRIWIISLLAYGASAATNSTPLSMRDDTNATFRANRSNLAINRIARAFRQCAIDCTRTGRRLFAPLSTSTNSPRSSPQTELR
jgi:hypothetical protein